MQEMRDGVISEWVYKRYGTVYFYTSRTGEISIITLKYIASHLHRMLEPRRLDAQIESSIFKKPWLM
jgi:hypothetical protein